MVDFENHASIDSVQKPLKGTMSEKVAFNQDKEESIANEIDGLGATACPVCGYQVSPHMVVCPACGSQLAQKNVGSPKSPSATKTCNNCGAAINSGSKFCPNCGKPLRMGTVNSWAEANSGAFFTLQPIAWDKENVQYQPVSYCGDSVILNRANTDPNNNTITSKVQAVISRNGDKWYIEDKSEFQSTLLRVNGKVELHDGDVLVLGTRKFVFNG